MNPILVHAVIFAGAFLQGVTGIGFALIVAPVLLLALNDHSAFQIAALLSLFIAIVMIPVFFREVDRVLLRRFSVSALLIMPLGLFLFAPILSSVGSIQKLSAKKMSKRSV